MEKVFVLSDHFELARFLIKTVRDNEQILGNRGLDLYTSPGRLSPDFIDLGASAIDLKQQGNIRMILDTYSIGVSIHSRQIFPSEIVNSMSCFNLHPGFNPHNRGWFPHIFSILNGLPAGATLHVMTDEIDSGPIVEQIEVEVLEIDTSSELYSRVIEAEKRVLFKNLPAIISGSAKVHEVEFEGNYNSKSDFEKLRRLDLSHQGSLEDHVKLIRALSHEPYANGYFEKDGVRYVVNASLRELHF